MQLVLVYTSDIVYNYRGLAAEHVCPCFTAYCNVTACSSCLLSLYLGQEDLQLAAEGADSVVVSV